MTKFKAGDRVRILTVDGSSCKEECIGKIGTVVHDTDIYPDVNCGVHVRSCFRNAQIQHVSPEERRGKTRPLQAGDKVATYGTTGNIKAICVVSIVTKVDGDLVHLDTKSAFQPYRSEDGGYDLTVVHRKQCRRIVRRCKKCGEEQ